LSSAGRKLTSRPSACGNRPPTALFASFPQFDPRVWVIVSGGVIGVAARMSTMTFLSIYFVREVGLSTAFVGMAFLIENLARGLFAPFVGALSDRIGRRAILIAGVIVTGVALPGFLWVDSPATLIAWSLAMGIASAAQWSTGSAMLIDLSPPEKRQTVLAIHYSAICVGYTIGVAPAGFLAEKSYDWLAIGSAVGFFLLTLLYVVGLRGTLPRDVAPGGGSFVTHSFTALRDRWFLRLAIPGLVFPIGIGLTAFVAALWAAELGLDKGNIGLALSANGVLIALLAIPVASRIEPRGPFRVLGLAALFAAAGYLVFAAFDSPGWALLVGIAVFTLGETIFSSALPAAVARLAPAGYRGTYQGTWSLVSSIGSGGALVASGWLRDGVGWDTTWVTFAVLTLAGGALLVAMRRGFEDEAMARARDGAAG
jgi:MFS family permease